MTNDSPVRAPRLHGWTVADIDIGVPVIRAKRDAALQRGDLAAALSHEAWMNRLLDARPAHAACEGRP